MHNTGPHGSFFSALHLPSHSPHEHRAAADGFPVMLLVVKANVVLRYFQRGCDSISPEGLPKLAGGANPELSTDQPLCRIL